ATSARSSGPRTSGGTRHSGTSSNGGSPGPSSRACARATPWRGKRALVRPTYTALDRCRSFDFGRRTARKGNGPALSHGVEARLAYQHALRSQHAGQDVPDLPELLQLRPLGKAVLLQKVDEVGPLGPKAPGGAVAHQVVVEDHPVAGFVEPAGKPDRV